MPVNFDLLRAALAQLMPHCRQQFQCSETTPTVDSHRVFGVRGCWTPLLLSLVYNLKIVASYVTTH